MEIVGIPTIFRYTDSGGSPDQGMGMGSDAFYVQLVEDSGPFLFPCTIEFSLICAAVLFIMWRHVSTEHQVYWQLTVAFPHPHVLLCTISGVQVGQAERNQGVPCAHI